MSNPRDQINANPLFLNFMASLKKKNVNPIPTESIASRIAAIPKTAEEEEIERIYRAHRRKPIINNVIEQNNTNVMSDVIMEAAPGAIRGRKRRRELVDEDGAIQPPVQRFFRPGTFIAGAGKRSGGGSYTQWHPLRKVKTFLRDFLPASMYSTYPKTVYIGADGKFTRSGQGAAVNTTATKIQWRKVLGAVMATQGYATKAYTKNYATVYGSKKAQRAAITRRSRTADGSSIRRKTKKARYIMINGKRRKVKGRGRRYVVNE